MMRHFVAQGKSFDWSRDEVIIDGKSYSRADWNDPVDAGQL